MSEYPMLRNAPLVEVIAEVHWALPATQGLRPSDPNWFALARDVGSAIQRFLPHLEMLQPAGTSIPLDVLGRSPLIRYRPEPGAWPLAQLGQGILTVNATPPYDGWQKVSRLLADVLKAATDGSPILRDMHLERYKLQYRDAFRRRHGVTSPQEFLQKRLAICAPAPWLQRMGSIADESSAAVQGAVSFGLLKPRSAVATVNYGGAQFTSEAGTEDVAVVDFIVWGNASGRLEIDKCLGWYEEAHDAAALMFQTLVPEDIMGRLK